MKEQTMSKIDDQGVVRDSSAAVDESTNSAPTSFTPPHTVSSPPSNPPASAFSDSILPVDAFCLPRDHVRRLVQRALVEIYGRDGPDLGETEDMCHRKVDAWLRKHDRRTVSRATLRRAKNGLRSKLRQSAIDLA
jgi:hypothetical protein